MNEASERVPFPIQDNEEHGEPVPENDLPDELRSQAGEPVPDSDLPDELKGGVAPQQIGAGAEGVAEGLSGPIIPALENQMSHVFHNPDLSYKSQAEREQNYPLTKVGGKVVGLGAGMATGQGLWSRAGQVGEMGAQALNLGDIGSTFLKGAVQNGVSQGGDELTRMALGQVDPNEAVSSKLMRVGGAFMIGGLLPAAGAKAVSAAKTSLNVKNFLAGIGSKEISKAASQAGQTLLPESEEQLAKFANPGHWADQESKMFKLGQLFHDKATRAVVGTGAGLVGGLTADAAANAMGADPHSSRIYGVMGGLASSQAAPYIEKLVGKAVSHGVDKFILKALSEGKAEGIPEAIEHISQMQKGAQMAKAAVSGVFQAGPQKVFNDQINDGYRRKIEEHLDAGGVNSEIEKQRQQESLGDVVPEDDLPDELKKKPGFASGGMVARQAPAPNPVLPATDAVATHFPEHAMLLGMAKGRISNYLGSLRPQKNPAKLPYDADPHQGPREKSYKKAVDLAISPLTILNKVKDGSLTPEELGHFHKLYPEVYNSLSKQLTQKITEQQMSGDKIPYKTRQGLSMFLGAPLDSSFVPQNIQAAQNVFAQKKADQQSAMKNKKGTGKMGEMAKQFKTSEQAAQERQVEER